MVNLSLARASSLDTVPDRMPDLSFSQFYLTLSLKLWQICPYQLFWMHQGTCWLHRRHREARWRGCPGQENGAALHWLCIHRAGSAPLTNFITLFTCIYFEVNFTLTGWPQGESLWEWCDEKLRREIFRVHIFRTASSYDSHRKNWKHNEVLYPRLALAEISAHLRESLRKNSPNQGY